MWSQEQEYDRREREEALVAVLPDGTADGPRFTERALADNHLYNLLLDVCAIDDQPVYYLQRLSLDDLAYLEQCCANPDYLKPAPAGQRTA